MKCGYLAAIAVSIVSAALYGADGSVRYSAFCGGLDLAGEGYRVRGDMKAGRFSFLTPDGRHQWVEFTVAAAVNGHSFGSFALMNDETNLGTLDSYTLVYTNGSARAELAFLPTKAVFRLAFPSGRTKEPVRTVTLGGGSRTDSDYLFDPSVGRQPGHEFPASVTRTILPGLASPPPWVFSYRKEGREGCWSAALEPAREWIDFNAFRHEAGDGGMGWTVTYPVCSALEGAVVTPPLVLRFGDADFFAALARHVEDLKAEGKMIVPERKLPDWHGRTLACTWRFQREEPRTDQANEEQCEKFVKMLEDAGIDFGTLIIDDFWGCEHGLWEADPKKWRSLRGFIDRQHAKGRHVLLWVCTDGTGLPDEELQGGRNWNLESAAFQARLRASARRLLSDEPGCYNADGVKFDFTSTSPADYGKCRDVGCGYLLRRFEMLSEALLAVKPTAILDYQCTNPYFTHTLTMLRLNDYFGIPEHGFGEMRTRSRIARICAPGALIDTDHISYGDHSYAGGEEFFRRAHELGVPSLYLCPKDLENGELVAILRRQSVAAVRLGSACDATFADRLDASFAIGREKSIISPNDLGLVNGHLTLNGRIEDVAQVRGLYAPPYFCNDFAWTLVFNGSRMKAVDYTWRPEMLTRVGEKDGWTVTTRLVPVAGERAAIVEVTVRNGNAEAADLPLRQDVSGTVGRCGHWGFNRPSGESVRNGGSLELGAGEPARVVVRWTLGDADEAVLKDVRPGESRTFHVGLAIGDSCQAARIVRESLEDPAGTIRRGVNGWRERVRQVAAAMPDFDCDDPSLVRLYRRSLLHLMLVRWDVDAFRLRPYYATGGLNGGCLCNYLWNFGGPHLLWPLLDAAALKEHLKAFLDLDLTRCYAFAPDDGSPIGPYYPINQEKIVFLIDSYVRTTGDIGFLRDVYRGKTLAEWAVEMALAHDDLAKDAVLADYGETGKSHLELRRTFRYDGIMPDLNLRRVALLYMADGLCRIAGFDPKVDLVGRAKALKALVRRELWDADAGWFRAVCSDGKPTIRWTMQMFKAFGWGAKVLDPDMETALLGHLMNPREFLGEYGVHSLSKLDPAYDENDVDNGGPGACPSFAPAICDRLYRDGHFSEANDILMRLRWLGESLPYWGDSQYADRRDYRRDTPLQCDVEGACLAQTIVFGLFGIRIDDDLKVTFDPHLPDGVDRMGLSNLRLCGKRYAVECTRNGGSVVKEMEGEVR